MVNESQWKWIGSENCFRSICVNERYALHINKLWRLPQIFQTNEGQIIHDRRNQLRILHLGEHEVVVKSFARPNILNCMAYALFRSSKARRSYEYASLLRTMGFGSPAPVAYVEERVLGLCFTRSYYVCLRSTLPYTYSDLHTSAISRPDALRYLHAVGRFSARFHMAGMLHKDYNEGNLLLGMDAEGNPLVELIDLNRIRFRKVSVKQGCWNMMERLDASDWQLQALAESYAAERGADVEQCLRWMREAQDSRKRA